jgi:hypothetical protein
MGTASINTIISFAFLFIMGHCLDEYTFWTSLSNPVNSLL